MNIKKLDKGLTAGLALGTLGACAYHGFCDSRNIPFQGENMVTYLPTVVYTGLAATSGILNGAVAGALIADVKDREKLEKEMGSVTKDLRGVKRYLGSKIINIFIGNINREIDKYDAKFPQEKDKRSLLEESLRDEHNLKVGLKVGSIAGGSLGALSGAVWGSIMTATGYGAGYVLGRLTE